MRVRGSRLKAKARESGKNVKFKVVSLDIFQTLVDVNARIPDIWRAVLGDGYSGEAAAAGAAAIFSTYPAVYDKAVRSEKFMTMAEVYRECAEMAVKKACFKVSSEKLARELMLQHSKAPFYPEVPKALSRLKEAHRVVLSSDSSHLMVDGLLERFGCREVFISDDLECYKGDGRGRFFSLVLRRLGAAPDEVIHIGDSAADVLGARRAGIASCFLNRDGRPPRGDVLPDFTVRDLEEFSRLVET